MDSLEIIQLKVNTQIGIHAWEQRIKQPLLLDISVPIQVNFPQEEDIHTVLDYDALCQKVTLFLETNAFQLIETVACRVASFIKQEFQVPSVKVSVAKPHAIKNSANVKVSVSR